MELTPEQKNLQKSWAFIRDEHLKENSRLKTERDTELKALTEIRQAVSDERNELFKIKGVVEEIKNTEIERGNLISKELIDLEVKKTKLESSISILEKEESALLKNKERLMADVKLLQDIHDRASFQVNALDKTIERVVRIGEENLTDVLSFVKNLKNDLVEISKTISDQNSNVSQRLKDLSESIGIEYNINASNSNAVKILIKELELIIKDLKK